MKCHICDATLSETETQWNSDHEDWDPCFTCLHVIDEVFDDHLDEEEVRHAIEVELLFYGQDVVPLEELLDARTAEMNEDS